MLRAHLQEGLNLAVVVESCDGVGTKQREVVFAAEIGIGVKSEDALQKPLLHFAGVLGRFFETGQLTPDGRCDGSPDHMAQHPAQH